MKQICSVAVVLSVMVISGCNTIEREDGFDIKITSEYIGMITNREWTLQAMTIDEVEYPLSGKMPTMQFEDEGRVFGFSSVNRYFGAIEFDKQGEVKWSDGFGSTKMAGPPEAMEQENAFMKGLLKTDRLRLYGNMLTAYSMDKKTVLKFVVSSE